MTSDAITTSHFLLIIGEERSPKRYVEIEEVSLYSSGFIKFKFVNSFKKGLIRMSVKSTVAPFLRQMLPEIPTPHPS